MKEIMEDLISYENSEMSQEETHLFYQKLVDTGIIWKLNSRYADTAILLAEEGYIVMRFDDFLS